MAKVEVSPLNKLKKLKPYLTLEEAAKRLSRDINNEGVEVTEADILLLALDGDLTLSVRFGRSTPARQGELVKYEQTEWILATPSFSIARKPEPSSNSESKVKLPHALKSLREENQDALKSVDIPMMTSVHAGENRFINLEKWITETRGPFDLTMWGAEALHAERRYQRLTGAQEVPYIDRNGALLRDSDDNIWQLQEVIADGEDKYGSFHYQRDYYRPCGLPADSELVVRFDALSELEKYLLSDSESPEAPLDNRGQRSVKKIIDVLSLMGGSTLSPSDAPKTQGDAARIINQLAVAASLDISKTHKAAEVIKVKAELEGWKSLSITTMAKYLEHAKKIDTQNKAS